MNSKENILKFNERKLIERTASHHEPPSLQICSKANVDGKTTAITSDLHLTICD